MRVLSILFSVLFAILLESTVLATDSELLGSSSAQANAALPGKITSLGFVTIFMALTY